MVTITINDVLNKKAKRRYIVADNFLVGVLVIKEKSQQSNGKG